MFERLDKWLDHKHKEKHAPVHTFTQIRAKKSKMCMETSFSDLHIERSMKTVQEHTNQHSLSLSVSQTHKYTHTQTHLAYTHFLPFKWSKPLGKFNLQKQKEKSSEATKGKYSSFRRKLMVRGMKKEHRMQRKIWFTAELWYLFISLETINRIAPCCQRLFDVKGFFISLLFASYA